MEDFLRRIEPFICVMAARRSGCASGNGIPENTVIPCELLPAIGYTFRREASYARGKTLADWEGGYHNLADDDVMQLQMCLERQFPQYCEADWSYASNVLGPACMVLLIRERRQCSLREAERLFHQIVPMTDAEFELERQGWRAERKKRAMQ